MSKPFFADVGDFTTTNVGTGNETTANDTTANLGLANISAQALVASISPADIGGTTQNNYSPAGLATTGIINLTASSAAIITGLDASVVAANRLIYLYALPTNVGNVTINNEDAGSLAANRIDLPGAAPAVMTPGSALALRYDGGSSRWRALSSTSSTQLPSLIVTGPVTFSGVITPASLAASVNDYNPAGLSTCATIRQAVNAGVQATITGLTAQGTGGRRITFQNLGPGSLLFSSEDVSSAAANRFSMPGAATFEMLTDGAITFLYDGGSSRWIAENMTQVVPFIQINASTSPAAITGTVNNYNPTGLGTAGVVRQALSGTSILTGIAAQTDGRVLILENIDTVLNLTVTHEDTSSTAANRFTLPGGTPILLNPGAALIFIYDNTSARWRTIGEVGTTITPSSPQPGVFSDGSDGSVVFDGSSTILGFIPTSNRYTITRDLNCINCTINAGVVLILANNDTETNNGAPGNVHRLFCTGILTNNGKISANGHGGVANSGVVNAGAGGGYSGVAAGSGGQGNTTGGSLGASQTIHVWNTQAGTTAGLINSVGSNAVGNYVGGGGGGGSGSPGGAGGANTIANVNFGTTRDQRALTTGNTLQPQAIAFGGSGGGGGGGDAAHVGGAGGGGGGLVCVLARTIVGSGVFEAKGGDGNSGAVGNTGGGAGAGGGSVVLYYIVGIGLCTTNVSGGGQGAGSGTGGHGGTGAPGRVFLPQ